MIELRTLGALDLRATDGRDMRPLLRQPKRLALLVYLTLAGSRQFHRRDTIVALFWPELDDAHARGALRQALRFLRRVLGDEVVVTRGDDEIGIRQSTVSVDSRAFETAYRAGQPADALTVYRGDFLDGFFVSDAGPEFERWVDQERARLRAAAAKAAWAVAEEVRAAGDPSSAAEFARRAASFAPDSEAELARLVAFLDESGDRSGALAAYDDFARRLEAEYGAKPSPETQARIRDVRARTRAAIPNVPRTPTELPNAARDVSAPRAPDPRPRRFWPLVVSLAITGLLVLSAYAAVVASRRPERSRIAIAVLPIEGLIGDTALARLADGMTDELITDLAQVRTFDVINRRTMMTYRASKRSAQQVARERSADAVLVSGMQQAGDTVHMTVQLFMAGTKAAVWTNRFAALPGELPRMQRDVARAVAERVGATLGAAEEAGLAPGRAVDPAALTAYIRARYWWDRRGRENLFKAVGGFQHALDLDPTFAAAYSGMGDAYAQLGYGGYLRPDDAFPKAKAAAMRALELDPTLAEPHATLGFVAMYFDWDWPAAEREYQLALTRNPSYATAHEWYGLFLAAMGRFDEAQTEERRALELDPLSLGIAGTGGWVLHYSGKQADAERQLRIALRTDSNFAIGHLYLGRVLQFQGQYDSALVHFEATGPLRAWVPTIAGDGYVYAQQGKRNRARDVLLRLDSLSRTEYVTSYAVALVHAALGQRDSAFVWLDRAVQERTHWLLWLNRDRRWDPIRSDSRFRALVRRVGLPS